MTIELPSPPTLNTYWRHVVLGKRVCTLLSKDGRLYKQAVAAICREQGIKPISGPLRVDLTWRRPTKAGDLDNRSKAPLDALKGYAFDDDSQIIELHMYRADDKLNPGMTVEVTPL